jgi:hypothetical protein
MGIRGGGACASRSAGVNHVRCRDVVEARRQSNNGRDRNGLRQRTSHPTGPMWEPAIQWTTLCLPRAGLRPAPTNTERPCRLTRNSPTRNSAPSRRPTRNSPLANPGASPANSKLVTRNSGCAGQPFSRALSPEFRVRTCSLYCQGAEARGGNSTRLRAELVSPGIHEYTDYRFLTP